jgi:hypothetical protein
MVSISGSWRFAAEAGKGTPRGVILDPLGYSSLWS